MKKWNKLYKQKKLNIPNTIQSINSWLGHSSHCNSYKLQQKVLNDCDFLINNNYYFEQEQYLKNLISEQIKESF